MGKHHRGNRADPEISGKKAYGVVFPLLTAASGVKFGKTEAGAVWLDPERTSPYRFYQYWLNTEDADVGGHLRLFTLLSEEEIEALDESVENRPHERKAQEALADDVTRRVHGETELQRAKRASRALFEGEVRGLSAEEIQEIFADVPSGSVPAKWLEGEGADLTSLIAEVGLTSSRGEARRGVEQGGVLPEWRAGPGRRLSGDRRACPTWQIHCAAEGEEKLPPGSGRTIARRQPQKVTPQEIATPELGVS